MKVKVLNTRKKPERVFGERVVLPEFEIVSCPTVRLLDIRTRKFDISDRVQRSAREEIAAQEDKAVFAALDAVSQNEIVLNGCLGTSWGVDIVISGNEEA